MDAKYHGGRAVDVAEKFVSMAVHAQIGTKTKGGHIPLSLSRYAEGTCETDPWVGSILKI